MPEARDRRRARAGASGRRRAGRRGPAGERPYRQRSPAVAAGPGPKGSLVHRLRRVLVPRSPGRCRPACRGGHRAIAAPASPLGGREADQADIRVPVSVEHDRSPRGRARTGPRRAAAAASPGRSTASCARAGNRISRQGAGRLRQPANPARPTEWVEPLAPGTSGSLSRRLCSGLRTPPARRTSGSPRCAGRRCAGARAGGRGRSMHERTRRRSPAELRRARTRPPSRPAPDVAAARPRARRVEHGVLSEATGEDQPAVRGIVVVQNGGDEARRGAGGRGVGEPLGVAQRGEGHPARVGLPRRGRCGPTSRGHQARGPETGRASIAPTRRRHRAPTIVATVRAAASPPSASPAVVWLTLWAGYLFAEGPCRSGAGLHHVRPGPDGIGGRWSPSPSSHPGVRPGRVGGCRSSPGCGPVVPAFVPPGQSILRR